jgi:hypothetical protein
MNADKKKQSTMGLFYQRSSAFIGGQIVFCCALAA